jgi:hypothetical protein
MANQDVMDLPELGPIQPDTDNFYVAESGGTTDRRLPLSRLRPEVIDVTGVTTIDFSTKDTDIRIKAVNGPYNLTLNGSLPKSLSIEIYGLPSNTGAITIAGTSGLSGRIIEPGESIKAFYDSTGQALFSQTPWMDSNAGVKKIDLQDRDLINVRKLETKNIQVSDTYTGTTTALLIDGTRSTVENLSEITGTFANWSLLSGDTNKSGTFGSVKRRADGLCDFIIYQWDGAASPIERLRLTYEGQLILSSFAGNGFRGVSVDNSGELVLDPVEPTSLSPIKPTDYLLGWQKVVEVLPVSGPGSSFIGELTVITQTQSARFQIALTSNSNNYSFKTLANYNASELVKSFKVVGRSIWMDCIATSKESIRFTMSEATRDTVQDSTHLGDTSNFSWRLTEAGGQADPDIAVQNLSIENGDMPSYSEGVQDNFNGLGTNSTEVYHNALTQNIAGVSTDRPMHLKVVGAKKKLIESTGRVFDYLKTLFTDFNVVGGLPGVGSLFDQTSLSNAPTTLQTGGKASTGFGFLNHAVNTPGGEQTLQEAIDMFTGNQYIRESLGGTYSDWEPLLCTDALDSSLTDLDDMMGTGLYYFNESYSNVPDASVGVHGIVVTKKRPGVNTDGVVGVHQIAFVGGSQNGIWRRQKNGGTWSIWYNLLSGGGGATILKATKDVDADGDWITNTSKLINITLTGAVLGDSVNINPNETLGAYIHGQNASVDMKGYVSAANTVTAMVKSSTYLTISPGHELIASIQRP